MARLFTFLALLIFPFYFAASAQAGSDVAVAAEVTYNYDTSGRCNVLHQITLTNGSSHVYPSSYQLYVSGPAPEEISVSNHSGPLKYTLQNISSMDTEITIYLTSPIVGYKNSQQFSIRYRCPPANHRGQIWEIILPKIKDINFYDRYELQIQTPDEFGGLAFISPSGASKSQNVYSLNKQQLDNSPVNAVYGQFRTYAFKITYPLNNPGFTDQKILIPVPADSSYQKVYYDSLSPLPSNVNAGVSGDWEAEIQLKPKSRQNFTISGQVRILPSASSLPVILPHASSSRRVVGLVDSQLTSWTEYWDETQSTWYAPDFSINHFNLCTFSPECRTAFAQAVIQLQPADFKEYPRNMPEVRWRQPLQVFPFLTNHSYLEITNTEAQAIYWTPVSVGANSIHITTAAAHNIPVIPPYGKVEIPVYFNFSPLPDFSPRYISIRVGSSLLTYNIPDILFLSWHVILTVIISAFFVLMAGIAVRSWSVHLQRQDSEDHLRR